MAEILEFEGPVPPSCSGCGKPSIGGIKTSGFGTVIPTCGEHGVGMGQLFWPWDLPWYAQTETVLNEVGAERVRQDEKFGTQRHLPNGTAADRGPIAEYAKFIANQAAENGVLTWYLILGEEWAEAACEEDPARLREELIQVAAVAVAWVEAIDQNNQGDEAQ